MVMKQVANHQNARLLPRDLDEFLALIQPQSKRLFHEDIFAVEHGFLREFIVAGSRSGEYHGLYFGHRQQFLVVAAGKDRIGMAHLFEVAWLHVTDSGQGSQVMKIADEITAPVTATHHSYLNTLMTIHFLSLRRWPRQLRFMKKLSNKSVCEKSRTSSDFVFCELR